jgi:putative acyl-CoA dehydrogenase
MFGGIGYLEDSGIPVMLRDAQVLSIWEGITNVLSLDMLRAAEKENGLQEFKEFSKKILTDTVVPQLTNQKETAHQKANALFTFINNLKCQDALIAASRDIAFYVLRNSWPADVKIIGYSI